MSLLQDSAEDHHLMAEMLHRLQAHDKERLRGFRLAEALDPFKDSGDEGYEHIEGKLEPIPPDEFGQLHELLRREPDIDQVQRPIPKNAIFVSAISKRQDVYAIWNSPRYKDSRIMFLWDNVRYAGVIQRILLYRHRQSSGLEKTRAFVLVQWHERVDKEDPFQRHGDAGGFCCKPGSVSMRLIPLEAVASHVAWTELHDEGVVHVLPLNRVSGHTATSRSFGLMI